MGFFKNIDFQVGKNGRNRCVVGENFRIYSKKSNFNINKIIIFDEC